MYSSAGGYVMLVWILGIIGLNVFIATDMMRAIFWENLFAGDMICDYVLIV